MTYEIPAQVLAANGPVFFHAVGDTTVVVKQDRGRRSSPLLRLVQALLYRLTGLPLLAPTGLPPGVAPTAFEAGVIRRYRALGLPVPEVLYQGKTYFVMSRVGENAEAFLRGDWPPARKYALLEQVIGVLRRLHRAGFAHGGAQIRNFAWDGARVAMFDFEENTTAAPLPDMQRRDLLLLILSVQYRLPEIDPAWVCAVYDGDGTGQTLAHLRTSLRRHRWLNVVKLWPLSRIRMKDVRNLIRLIEKISPNG